MDSMPYNCDACGRYVTTGSCDCYRSSAPPAPRELTEVEVAELIQEHTGCADSDSIYAAAAVLAALRRGKP